MEPEDPAGHAAPPQAPSGPPLERPPVRRPITLTWTGRAVLGLMAALMLFGVAAMLASGNWGGMIGWTLAAGFCVVTLIQGNAIVDLGAYVTGLHRRLEAHLRLSVADGAHLLDHGDADHAPPPPWQRQDPPLRINRPPDRDKGPGGGCLP